MKSAPVTKRIFVYLSLACQRALEIKATPTRFYPLFTPAHLFFVLGVKFATYVSSPFRRISRGFSAWGRRWLRILWSRRGAPGQFARTGCSWRWSGLEKRKPFVKTMEKLQPIDVLSHLFFQIPSPDLQNSVKWKMWILSFQYVKPSSFNLYKLGFC